jgi:hypothetical protein
MNTVAITSATRDTQPRGTPAWRLPDPWFWILVAGMALLGGLLLFAPEIFAQAQLPGTDASDQLEAAGTLLRIIDTALFKWAARIFAGLCLLSTAWSLKEQRIGIAIICIVAAILFGSAPTWVKNIFSIASADSVFG